MPYADEHEEFDAADADIPQFDNDKLLAVMAVIETLVNDPVLYEEIHHAVLVEIYGEAQEI